MVSCNIDMEPVNALYGPCLDGLNEMILSQTLTTWSAFLYHCQPVVFPTTATFPGTNFGTEQFITSHTNST